MFCIFYKRIEKTRYIEVYSFLNDGALLCVLVCRCIWLYLLIKSPTRFRVNPHPIVWAVWLNGWLFVYELSGCGFESSCSHLKASDFFLFSSKGFLDIQATIRCGFTLKRMRGMVITYSQMHRTDNYTQHSSII